MNKKQALNLNINHASDTELWEAHQVLIWKQYTAPSKKALNQQARIEEEMRKRGIPQ